MKPINQDTPPVTELLDRWSDGDKRAFDQLMPLVVDELRRLARVQLGRESEGHTLQPTALVNELYLRLLGRRSVDWKNRAQFFGFAARAMRWILTDHARSKRREKRGGHDPTVSLEQVGDLGTPMEIDALRLDDALKALETMDERQCRVVELRFFAGLSTEEAAEALGVGVATVVRDWASARAWLQRELAR